MVGEQKSWKVKWKESKSLQAEVPFYPILYLCVNQSQVQSWIMSQEKRKALSEAPDILPCR